MEKPLNILSFGAGWQSTVLYFMSSMGELPVRFDAAIFADTGKEQPGTYRYMEWLLIWQKEHSAVPIIWLKERNLYGDLINGYDGRAYFKSIPAYTRQEDGSIGMLKRQCTNNYKIEPVYKEIRKIQGLKPRQRNIRLNLFIGLTVDELSRFSRNQVKEWDNIYPLAGGFVISSAKDRNGRDISLDKKMHTNDCPKWLQDHGLPAPPRSACTFCPFQSDDMWKWLKTNEPKEWEDIINLDESIRDSTNKGAASPIYLHRSARPLKNVIFANEKQASINFECSGTCNT